MLNFRPLKSVLASLCAVLALIGGSTCVYSQSEFEKLVKNEPPLVEKASPEAELGAANDDDGVPEPTAPIAPDATPEPPSIISDGALGLKRNNDYWKPTPDPAQPVEYEQMDAETARDRFNANSIRKLRKPMNEVRIVAEDGPQTPKNLAAQYIPKEPVLKIVAAGISPPGPDRYPIHFKHQPLYYEQPLLERCGRGCGLAQNAISAGQFCINTFFLPYHMCKTRPACLVASGGDCLSCQPYPVDCNPLPLNYRGLATEAAAFAGFSFLLL